jgi:CRP-like cAMP-binding protein
MVIPIQPSAAVLKDVKLLQVFSDSELNQLVMKGKSVEYEAHGNIVIEGELSWGLYLILEGMVGIYKTNKLTGDSYDVGQLKTGSFFGEMSLIDQNPRSATVKALTPSQLFFISKESFNDFLGQSSALKLKFYESCLKTLIHRLRELDDSYVISQYQLWKIAFKRNPSTGVA